MAGVWKKALIYLGLVEEEDDLEPLPEVHEPPQLESVRPLRPESQAAPVRPVQQSQATAPTMPSVAPMVVPQVRVHVIEPKRFEDAQEIGDKVKVDQPVIMNLQQVDSALGHRLVDFAAGLTYGVSGKIKKVADRVFLLTPPNVEVSEEETQRIISERGFFNQF